MHRCRFISRNSCESLIASGSLPPALPHLASPPKELGPSLGACPTIGNLDIDTAITCSRAILWRQARQHEMLQLRVLDRLLDLSLRKETSEEKEVPSRHVAAQRRTFAYKGEELREGLRAK